MPTILPNHATLSALTPEYLKYAEVELGLAAQSLSGSTPARFPVVEGRLGLQPGAATLQAQLAAQRRVADVGLRRLAQGWGLT